MEICWESHGGLRFYCSKMLLVLHSSGHNMLNFSSKNDKSHPVTLNSSPDTSPLQIGLSVQRTWMIRSYNPGQKYWDNTLKWTHFWHPPPTFNVASFWSIFRFACDTASIILHGGMTQHWWRGAGEEEWAIFPRSSLVRLAGRHLQCCPRYYGPGL